eukprot:CAMPEP_0175821128 /NCGR_PEP_ID=MMETSP0107_2-20121207/8972_1 /TAXON_ID=195067 ORGANISM="Goniomonas pacifica, Strain CCMP1869" /NCGR_SAMPLE_ID=MMETSP0107_2 /ASSEMBLY_ACC=CAM_ASM_000203 /LENGTH=84 /DNA_ID=CAMNT_0017133491 /DNA_START=435 /DNA_END=690 /DNA_ORIENTATION=-
MSPAAVARSSALVSWGVFANQGEVLAQNTVTRCGEDVSELQAPRQETATTNGISHRPVSPITATAASTATALDDTMALAGMQAR